MFFDDRDLKLRRRARLAVPPRAPIGDWRPPAYFPDLSSADVIAFDVEAREDDFDRIGPGWPYGRSQICGFSVAAQRGLDTGRWYFPIRHEVQTDWNLDPVASLAWLKATLETEVPKVGANLLYDVGTLLSENIRVGGELYDVQFAEALIDEEALVALENLAGKYLGESKITSELYDWCARAYGGNATSVQRANIFRAPPSIVGPYGEADADLPLRIFMRQAPILENEGLVDLFRMECRLIRLLLRMRQQGVRVDMDAAHTLFRDLGHDAARLEAALASEYGVQVNVDSGDDLAKLFRTINVEYPTTATGAPSFRKDWLKNLAHPVGNQINEIREIKKARATFVKGYLIERSKNGLIHCQFHPLKNDENGAKTGRFASSDPNLQNIPIRSATGQKIRSAFIPHFEHQLWAKRDYSQIEYRMLAHYATDNGDGSADLLRQTYCSQNDTDYHKVVQARVEQLLGMKIDRKPIKNLNFGLLYGQGLARLMRMLGLDQTRARAFIATYFEAAPYVKPTMSAISQEVQTFGYVRTILNRRARFNLWEPAVTRYGDDRQIGLPYEMAINRYGPGIKRAYDYRGTNYKFQGSAADIIKKAMVDADAAGVYDAIGVPLIQVHDELGNNVSKNQSAYEIEAFRELDHIMENAVQCRVPIRIDTKLGPNWGAID